MPTTHRTKKTLYFDNLFCEWANAKSESSGIPVSRLVEMATIEKYKDEYESFKKNHKGGETK